MNALAYLRRPAWSYAVVLLGLTAGCHSLPFGRRPTFTAAPPASAAPAPTLNAAATPALGTSLEDIDARNRADIAAQLGRPVAPGPATPAEVAAMTQAGVDSRFIISYINRSTNLVPIAAEDVIFMHQHGVDDQVIQAMLTPGASASRAEVARAMPPRVIIVDDPWWPYYYGPRYGAAIGYGGCYCR